MFNICNVPWFEFRTRQPALGLLKLPPVQAIRPIMYILYCTVYRRSWLLYILLLMLYIILYYIYAVFAIVYMFVVFLKCLNNYQ